MKRREFFRTTLAVGVAAATTSLRAQDAKPRPPAQSIAKVEKLFKVPGYTYANALETAPDGLWVGDQVTEKIARVDWQTGKILQEVQLESHNMSGLGVGGGYIWAGSNGGVSGRRPPRPTDKDYGEDSQLDMKTGKIVKVYRPPWGGGVHGVTYSPLTNTLWVAALSLQAVAEMDPKDNLRILRMYRTTGERQHGLDVDKNFLWMLMATDRQVHRYDLNGGRLVEIITIPDSAPDAHGLALHNGYLYYCDSGLTLPGPGTSPGQVCRFRVDTAAATN